MDNTSVTAKTGPLSSAPGDNTSKPNDQCTPGGDTGSDAGKGGIKSDGAKQNNNDGELKDKGKGANSKRAEINTVETHGVSFQGDPQLVIGNLHYFIQVVGGKGEEGKKSDDSDQDQFKREFFNYQKSKESDVEEPDKKSDQGQPLDSDEARKNKRTTKTRAAIDLTVEFPVPRGIRPLRDQAQLIRFQEKLSFEKLLFISCADEQMAKSGAYSLVQEMRLIEPEQRRLLDFIRLNNDKTPLEIYSLFEINEQDTEVAVVVDLFNPKAEAFFDSLLESIVRSPDHLQTELRRSKIYVICVLHVADLRKKLGIQNAANDFPHWNIPFLRPLLRHHYPENYQELETKILARRNQWSPDEKTFCLELKTQIMEDRLIQILEKPVETADFLLPNTLLKNEDALVNTVLYVATFFKDLKPREFQRLVNLLLGNKTKTITISEFRKTESGAIEEVKVNSQKLLSEEWQESTDKTKSQCQLTAVSAPDGTTIVSFKNHQLREELREYLRSEYAFYLNTQFEQLMNAGLLFDSSVSVANNLIQLTAEMASADPEYIKEWFGGLLDELAQASHEQVDSPARAISPALKSLASLSPHEAQVRFCQRLAALIRRILEIYQLKNVVDDFLEQIMRHGFYWEALEVVKLLRFAVHFDEFYWLKQLIERGKPECKDETVSYLAQRMENAGPRVYQMLTAMDPWVKINPVPESYSRSGGEALWLLIDFCVTNTRSFDQERYGIWPSPHPLFGFRDAKTAHDNLGLLTRWLFHPWLKAVFDEEIPDHSSLNYSIGALIAEWGFILLRPADGPISPSTTVGAPMFALTASEVHRILIDRVVESSNDEQKTDLLYYWESWSKMLLCEIGQTHFTTADRDLKIWKRNLLNDLIMQFKNSVYERELLVAAYN